MTTRDSRHFARLVLVVSALSPALALAQSFEVASIRPSNETPGCFSMLPPGGTHYVITCIPLKTYIAQAWKLISDNIQGGPSRVLAEPYDLSATTPDGQPWTYDSLRPMLRQMLIDRFHLAVHEGTKQVSG
jgi:uncharacterized protein (TIGR03435 family)